MSRCTEYYAIVRRPAEFKKQFEAALDVLSFHEHDAKIAVPELDESRRWKKTAMYTWIAKIVSYASGIAALAPHPGNDDDLVLRVKVGKPGEGVQLDPKTFPNVSAANKAFAKDPSTWNRVSLLFNPGLDEDERKVNTTYQLLPSAEPTHYKTKGDANAYDIAQLMDLHRRLHLGTGFHFRSSD
ncbi:unnamed protein product [Clonostachys chloroleuca]|uniref:Uncharacterized protein n=1 Tax=Clonostachys chloroleuca TaxID=1926264 RepID=A0AA35M5V2_9HYPO|nr:unnamed protein product [Clonostachys chloroleuca]